MSTSVPTHNLSIFVANRPGALARIAQTFSRRGFNIESLVVSPAANSDLSRMTITAKGREAGLEQIIMQCNKLVDVLACREHTDEEVVARELALVKVAGGWRFQSRAELSPYVERCVLTGQSARLSARRGHCLGR